MTGNPEPEFLDETEPHCEPDAALEPQGLGYTSQAERYGLCSIKGPIFWMLAVIACAGLWALLASLLIAAG